MTTPLINELKDPTPGERKFVRLISNLNEENSQFEFRLYFEPEGRKKFPDFVLYSSYFGIIFFEIKDISIGEINSFDLHKTVFQRKNTLDKLSFERPKVVFDYIERFKITNANIPVCIFYVFSNISEVEIQQKFEFDVSRKDNPFIFSNDFIDYDSFLEKLTHHRIFPYDENDRSKQIAIDRITHRQPQSVIQKNNDGTIELGLFENLSTSNDIFVLSKHQEQILRNFMNHQGFRFLKGHAGTGKTVLIIARAEFLAQTFKQSKILITYYTSQLDGVFHHLMNKYPSQITAQRMGQFCHANIKKKEESLAWSKYYSECSKLISDPNHPFYEYFDFVLVDEGQDFIPELGMVIENISKGKNYTEKNVLIAFDDYQALNLKGKIDTTATFRGKQRGRVKRLTDSFRTPMEIAKKASRLINEEIQSVRSVKNSYYSKKLSDRNQIMPFIDNTINKAKANERVEMELRDIAIIYPHLSELHNQVKEDLKSFPKPYQTYHKEKRKVVIMENNNVKVLSSTYCKGLDFRIVFLIYFDELKEEGQENANKKAREHLYVSMTRTRDYLFVLTIKENSLIEIINEDTDEDKKHSTIS